MTPSTPASNPQQESGRPPREAVVVPIGAKVLVAGGDGVLGRLITKRLFGDQLRPYLLMSEDGRAPSGLGIDQHKGLIKMVDPHQPLPEEVKALVLVNENGKQPPG